MKSDIRFDLTKHTPEDSIDGSGWCNRNIARWNRRAHAAHMTSVRAWADRCCRAHPPEDFSAVLEDVKMVKKYRKLGVNWLDMRLRNV